MKVLRDPLLWLSAMFIALLLALPYSAPLFSALFPELPRPVYQQESFVSLTLAHFWLVALSSLAATVVGVVAGIAVTRPAGPAGHAGRDWGGTVRCFSYRSGNGDDRLAEADKS